mmetsp:Transcript_93132/g.136026  ORF Transcript_93132/g.136026 Transcript_93132/m.136026 type:complete len:269 (-) Transcript_93132:124-930(-)
MISCPGGFLWGERDKKCSTCSSCLCDSVALRFCESANCRGESALSVLCCSGCVCAVANCCSNSKTCNVIEATRCSRLSMCEWSVCSSPHSVLLNPDARCFSWSGFFWAWHSTKARVSAACVSTSSCINAQFESATDSMLFWLSCSIATLSSMYSAGTLLLILLMLLLIDLSSAAATFAKLLSLATALASRSRFRTAAGGGDKDRIKQSPETRVLSFLSLLLYSASLPLSVFFADPFKVFFAGGGVERLPAVTLQLRSGDLERRPIFLA